jgi:hypothetical protein
MKYIFLLLSLGLCSATQNSLCAEPSVVTVTAEDSVPLNESIAKNIAILEKALIFLDSPAAADAKDSLYRIETIAKTFLIKVVALIKTKSLEELGIDLEAVTKLAATFGAYRAKLLKTLSV